MTAKNRANLATDIATLIDNTSGSITPQSVRTVLQDMVDSSEIDQIGIGINQILIGQSGSPPAWLSIVGGDILINGAAWSITNKQGYLFGLTISTAGGSSTFTVAAGRANDKNGNATMILAGPLNKTTGSWAAGNGNGALDTGAIANSTWYHVYLIERADGSVVDVLISASATSPTLPSGYVFSRRIGAMRTDGSAHWLAFTQRGDDFVWSAPTGDVAVANLGTTATLYTLTVPTGVNVTARLRGYFANAAPNTNLLITSPDETSAAANATAGNLTAITQINGQTVALGELRVTTNTSAQIRAVSSAASSTLDIATFGWSDTRGRLS